MAVSTKVAAVRPTLWRMKLKFRWFWLESKTPGPMTRDSLAFSELTTKSTERRAAFVARCVKISVAITATTPIVAITVCQKRRLA